MQFMPATFASYGVDGDGDGTADIDNVNDAIFSAANLLCANGAGDPAYLAGAVWNYNHAQSYVNEVLTLAAAYGVFEAPAGAAFAAANDLFDNRRVFLTPHARADLLAGAVDQTTDLPAGVDLTTTHDRGHRLQDGAQRLHALRECLEPLSRQGSGHLLRGRSASDRDQPRGLRLVLALASIEGPIRPDELGHPFGAIGFPGGFTDADHADHIHLGFDS